MYNWQLPGWPDFKLDESALAAGIQRYVVQTNKLSEKLQDLPREERDFFLLERMVKETMATSAIEGEILMETELVSFIGRHLNLETDVRFIKDQRVESAGLLIILNRATYDRKLSETALKYWHELLLSWDKRLNSIGDYRKGEGAMRIISGPAYRPIVHFEAPPSGQLQQEMEQLVVFCNTWPFTSHKEAVMKAGIAHIWFESIHPFEDGNGRIGRALIEKLLSQGLGDFIPFSISDSIYRRQKEYYQSLRQSQNSPDITAWMVFFIECLNEAVDYADALISFTVQKHAYFKRFDGLLSPPQMKAIGKMFLAGPEGFRGGMTAKKYVSITRASRATASRSLTELANLGALKKQGAGRSVHYTLVLE